MNTVKISFYRPKEVNIDEFETIIKNMRRDLNDLCAGNYDRDTTYAYVEELMKEARPLKHRSDVLCWGLDEPTNMPSDARVDFFFTPSYIATAFIIKSVIDYPEIIINNEIFECKMSKALRGVTLRKFAGHGYDGDRGRVEAIRIFASSGARAFIKKYPSICGEFNSLYENTIALIKKMLARSQAVGLWGDDFSKEAKEAILLDSAYL